MCAVTTWAVDSSLLCSLHIFCFLMWIRKWASFTIGMNVSVCMHIWCYAFFRSLKGVPRVIQTCNFRSLLHTDGQTCCCWYGTPNKMHSYENRLTQAQPNQNGMATTTMNARECNVQNEMQSPNATSFCYRILMLKLYHSNYINTHYLPVVCMCVRVRIFLLPDAKAIKKIQLRAALCVFRMCHADHCWYFLQLKTHNASFKWLHCVHICWMCVSVWQSQCDSERVNHNSGKRDLEKKDIGSMRCHMWTDKCV